MAGGMFKVEGGREVAGGLDLLGGDILAELATETRAAGLELQAAVRANATTGFHPAGQGHIPGTGPGPNVATGEYRASIKLRTRAGLLNPDNRGAFASAGTSVEVYTDAPQADRLEYGFHGVDSLGRTYRQQAYPHWGPAVEQVEPLYVEAVERAISAAIAGALR